MQTTISFSAVIIVFPLPAMRDTTPLPIILESGHYSIFLASQQEVWIELNVSI